VGGWEKKRNFEKTPSQETFCKKQSGSNNVAASCSQICFHYVSLVLLSCVGFVFLKRENGRGHCGSLGAFVSTKLSFFSR
jgi:hypothetical protein